MMIKEQANIDSENIYNLLKTKFERKQYTDT